MSGPFVGDKAASFCSSKFFKLQVEDQQMKNYWKHGEKPKREDHKETV